MSRKEHIQRIAECHKGEAEDDALLGYHFESKSFTPTEFIMLLKKYGLETAKIVWKPLGFDIDMLDSFVSALPAEKRRRIVEDTAEKKLAEILPKFLMNLTLQV